MLDSMKNVYSISSEPLLQNLLSILHCLLNCLSVWYDVWDQCISLSKSLGNENIVQLSFKPVETCCTIIPNTNVWHINKGCILDFMCLSLVYTIKFKTGLKCQHKARVRYLFS